MVLGDRRLKVRKINDIVKIPTERVFHFLEKCKCTINELEYNYTERILWQFLPYLVYTCEWFSTGTQGNLATLVYVITMHVGICDTLKIAIIPTLWTSYTAFFFVIYTIVNDTPQCGENNYTDIV